jgi:hypothetical protein
MNQSLSQKEIQELIRKMNQEINVLQTNMIVLDFNADNMSLNNENQLIELKENLTNVLKNTKKVCDWIKAMK